MNDWEHIPTLEELALRAANNWARLAACGGVKGEEGEEVFLEQYEQEWAKVAEAERLRREAAEAARSKLPLVHLLRRALA